MWGLFFESIVRAILGFFMFLMTIGDNEMDLHTHCWEDHSGCWISDHNVDENERIIYIIFPNGD